MRTSAFSLAALWLSAAPVLVMAQSLKLPDGPGKEATEKVCGMCHGAELVLGRQETREVWGSIVDDMVQRGASGSEEEFYQIVDYLATNFSPTSPITKINVNKASAKDLESALKLPPKEASAIVDQRTAKGEFKSLEDLEKVPGVTASRIEANKKRLAF